MGLTLFEKVWESHVVRRAAGEPDLLYCDLHLLHEVSSPQAFDGLRGAGRTVRRPELTLALEDHAVPTAGLTLDDSVREQVTALRRNCGEFGIRLYSLGDVEQGIAGAQWRTAGCSMCVGLNPDRPGPGHRSASTSNRNFEGRQGPGSRTHLVSPLVAAATAVTGRLSAPGDLA